MRNVKLPKNMYKFLQPFKQLCDRNRDIKERRFVKREARNSCVSNSDYMEVEERDEIERQTFAPLENFRSRSIYLC